MLMCNDYRNPLHQMQGLRYKSAAVIESICLSGRQLLQRPFAVDPILYCVCKQQGGGGDRERMFGNFPALYYLLLTFKLTNSVLSNDFIYCGASDWWLWRRGRRVAIAIIIITIIIIIITDFIFYDSISKIFWSLHEIIFICKQESARKGELSEDRFMTPRQ
jgi:hypothetical protein